MAPPSQNDLWRLVDQTIRATPGTRRASPASLVTTDLIEKFRPTARSPKSGSLRRPPNPSATPANRSSRRRTDARLQDNRYNGDSARSHIHIGGQRIVLDEFTARFDDVAHQLGEDVVGLVDLLDLHLQERALVGVKRGFPELARIHLTEAFIALQL